MKSLITGVQNAYLIKVDDCAPYRNVWQLKTSEGTKCLKKVRYSREDAFFIFLATENLLTNGFKRFNRFVLAKTGEPYMYLEDELYVLSDWISGRQSDYTDPQALQITIKTLMDMQRASLGFQPPSLSKQRIKWGYWIDNFSERYQELKKFKKLASCLETFFDELFYIHAEKHIEEAEEAIALLEKSAYYRLVEEEEGLNGFCHHDFAYHNVLINNGEGYLIDFDYLICDLRCHDTASFMMRAIKDNSWQTKYAKTILEEYDRHAGLRKGEAELIAAFLKFPQDFWQAGYTYYVEKNRPLERMGKRLKNCITSMDLRSKCLEELVEVCHER